MIIDLHGHVFPRFGTDSEGQMAATQLQIIQHHVQFHTQGWRRRRDGRRADHSLMMPGGDSIADMPDVNLRVGQHGQLECTVDGEDYYLQWYPCWFVDMAASPELMITYMDYLGVDKIVLQHDHVYGSLNQYLSDCMRRFPGRFLPLAQICEWDTDVGAQSGRLEHAIKVLGLKGLYFEVEAFAFAGWIHQLDDARFEPLWDTVRRLEIPIFWYLCTNHRDRFNAYMEQVERLDRWAKAHSDIPSVFTHGIETIHIRPKAERFDIPEAVLTCLKNPNMYLEVMLHLMAPDTEYPFPWAQEILKRLYDELGPERLLWGSDMPAAERSVTYRQTMDYIRLHAEFMTGEDKALFFGGNAARLFGLDG
jgi:predicted TIM-barrel fold metal-dependent hydrolase